jgi:hypothetical protein
MITALRGFPEKLCPLQKPFAIDQRKAVSKIVDYVQWPPQFAGFHILILKN